MQQLKKTPQKSFKGFRRGTTVARATKFAYSPLRRMRDKLDTLQEFTDGELTVLQALVLLHVVIHEGQTTTEISDALGLSVPTVSRILDILGSHQGRAKRRRCAHVVERRDMPWDRRQRTVHLTAKGQLLAKELGK